ncbi:hypothetical protein EPO33_00425 [Patescibacteria group bacterium]|nr:MAG: hypothetical protein EPO33_00425 [Patescibacteria group bacterium]
MTADPYFQPVSGDELADTFRQKCGDSPIATYDTDYQFNYLNLTLLLGIVIVAALIIHKNRSRVAKHAMRIGIFLKSHILTSLLIILAITLSFSIAAGNLELRNRMEESLGRIPDHFYSVNHTPTKAYLDAYQEYWGCGNSF